MTDNLGIDAIQQKEDDLIFAIRRHIANAIADFKELGEIVELDFTKMGDEYFLKHVHAALLQNLQITEFVLNNKEYIRTKDGLVFMNNV